MVERKSGYAVIAKVAHKTSELVNQAIIEGLGTYAPRVKTLTYDNGKEFAASICIQEKIDGISYRGGNYNDRKQLE